MYTLAVGKEGEEEVGMDNVLLPLSDVGVVEVFVEVGEDIVEEELRVTGVSLPERFTVVADEGGDGACCFIITDDVIVCNWYVA